MCDLAIVFGIAFVILTWNLAPQVDPRPASFGTIGFDLDAVRQTA